MLDFLIERYINDYKSLATLNEDSEVRAYKKLLKKIIKDLKKVNQSVKTNKINFAFPQNYLNNPNSNPLSNSSATSSSDVLPSYADFGGDVQPMGESQDVMFQRIQENTIKALFNQNYNTDNQNMNSTQMQPFNPIMNNTQMQPVNQTMNNTQIQPFNPIMNNTQMPFNNTQKPNVNIPSDEELMKMNSIYSNTAMSLNPSASLTVQQANPFKNDPTIQKLKEIKFSESDKAEMSNLFKNVPQSVELSSNPDLSNLKVS